MGTSALELAAAKRSLVSSNGSGELLVFPELVNLLVIASLYHINDSRYR